VKHESHMDLLGMIYREVEQISAGKIAAAGGAGSGVSIATVVLVDPAALVPWMQVATLAVGLITGLGSAGLVYLKWLQLWRTRSKT
jgi:hypothetical protein